MLRTLYMYYDELIGYTITYADQVLEQLLDCLAAHLPLILRVADNVAMLDMLLAFSEVRTATHWQEQ